MIRQFETRDANQILDLCEQWSKEVGDGYATYNLEDLIHTFRQIAISRFHYSMVCQFEGKIIGFAVCQYAQNQWNKRIEGVIDWFYVKPEYRNLAQGRSLIDACFNWFKENNCEYFRTFVSAFNDDYQPAEEYLENMHESFTKKLTPIGSVYLGEIK